MLNKRMIENSEIVELGHLAQTSPCRVEAAKITYWAAYVVVARLTASMAEATAAETPVLW